MLCYNQFEEHRSGRGRIASFMQATSAMERSFRKQGAGVHKWFWMQMLGELHRSACQRAGCSKEERV
jgi:hypothetical protein